MRRGAGYPADKAAGAGHARGAARATHGGGQVTPGRAGGAKVGGVRDGVYRQLFRKCRTGTCKGFCYSTALNLHSTKAKGWRSVGIESGDRFFFRRLALRKNTLRKNMRVCVQVREALRLSWSKPESFLAVHLFLVKHQYCNIQQGGLLKSSPVRLTTPTPTPTLSPLVHDGCALCCRIMRK